MIEDQFEKLQQSDGGNKLLIFGVPESYQVQYKLEKDLISETFKGKIDYTFSESNINSCFRLKSANSNKSCLLELAPCC